VSIEAELIIDNLLVRGNMTLLEVTLPVQVGAVVAPLLDVLGD
jgi:hypothetical protein